MTSTILFLPILLVSTVAEAFVDHTSGTVKLDNCVVLTGEKTRESDSGAETAYAYYGYKYGTAERFKINYESIPNTDLPYLDWSDQRKGGYACPQPVQPPQQRPMLPPRKSVKSEDCPYLDVYVPPISADRSEKFPVLFFVHGGGFRDALSL
ncbi:hypothetical protein BV898_03367 [Hypsibius exemplaris]|uniref:Carboxylesterase type B domain-containing protein n=1 Tax=Hypsibius exemplaris TaxID=2072580 RepID=A0A1W0X5C6_HYPEX|nr:hypothetical protein BV898_03367 [Hypsibius exemplaris]